MNKINKIAKGKGEKAKQAKEMIELNKKETERNTAQELQFRLMELASFNNFNSREVVEDLKAHKKLWKAVVIGRDPYIDLMDLICLRDLPKGSWNVDTVYIMAVPGKEKDLELLIRRSWNADEIDWLDQEQVDHQLGTSGYKYSIVRVWWD